MKPDFKSIDITADAFGAQPAAAVTATGDWLTPELIPVKPVYTKEDLQGLEHRNYISGEAAAAGVWLHGAAGDACARELGQYGMLPTDMLNTLPRLLK